MSKLKYLPFLLLAGCVNAPQATPAQQQAITFAQACSGYAAALSSAIALNNQGKLAKSQVQAITLIDADISPICTGPVPANNNVLITKVTAATTQLLLQSSAK